MANRTAHSDEGIVGLEKARRYAESHRKYARIMYRPLLRVLRELGLPGRYLEIGAGPGFLAAIIAEKNPDVKITTLDISPDMVSLAREHVAAQGVQDRVRCVLGDVADRSLLESLGQFDLVYSTFSVHHWKDPERCLSGVRAAVRDGGAAYIYDLNRAWWLRLMPFAARLLRQFKHAYSSSEMRAIVEKVGCESYTMKTHYAGLLQSVLIR